MPTHHAESAPAARSLRRRARVVTGGLAACGVLTIFTGISPSAAANLAVHAAPSFGRVSPPSPPSTPSAPATPAAPTCGGETVLKADGTTWTCTFDDEFSAATSDATALDSTKWVPQLTSTSGYVTGTTGALACYVNSTNNISVSGGDLNLTARQETTPFSCSDPYGNFTTSYTAGMVSSAAKFSQTYGRFEVSAKLPTTTAAGLQETLWLWPTNATKYGSWPGSGEIDYSEFYSQYPTLDVPYLHYNYDPSTTNTSTNTNVVTKYNCTINYGQFNTYVATWEPGSVTISVNGSACLTDNYQATGLASPAPFDQPFMLALTQALGMGTNAFVPGTTPLPATTSIDYVRVWK